VTSEAGSSAVVQLGQQQASRVRNLVRQDRFAEAIEVLKANRQLAAVGRALADKLRQLEDDALLKGLVTEAEYRAQRSKFGEDILRALVGAQPLSLLNDLTSQEWEALMRLMAKVENNWIENFYQDRLRGALPIRVRLKADFDSVDRSFADIQEPPQIPHDIGIEDVYRRMGGRLLILGAAGSGKTFALIQIASVLIDQVKVTREPCIPVVLDLATWQEESKELEEWAVDQIAHDYIEERNTVRSWLEDRRLILLLDGLDRVEEERQDDCVRAINALREKPPHGLVVCSRTEAYTRLPVKLELPVAVHLEPLSQQEIVDYVRERDSSSQSLLDALQSDAALNELAETPLGLELLYDTFGERGTTQQLADLSAGTMRDRRQHLFDAYIDRVLNLPGQKDRPFSAQETTWWLAWLAHQMTKHNVRLLWFERIQPGWLPSPAWQRAYILISRITVGFLAGLMGGPFIGLALGISWHNLARGLVEGLTAGLIGGIVIGLFNAYLDESVARFIHRNKLQRWHALINIVLVVLGVALAAFPVFWLVFGSLELLGISADIWRYEGADVSILVGLSFGLVFGFIPHAGRRRLAKDIHAGSMETLKWSSLRARTFGLYGTVIGAVAGFATAFVSSKSPEAWSNPLIWWAYRLGMRGWGVLTAVAVLGAVTCGLLGLFVAGLTGRAIHPDHRTNPWQSIRLAWHNAVLIGCAAAVAFVVIGLILQLLAGAVGLSLVLYGLYVGYLAFLWFGGLDIYLHLILRLMLWIMDRTPRLGKYETFLRYSAGLRFLQAVLGGYQFAHEYWREHFAAMYDSIERPSILTKLSKLTS
jgi:hypothetical protein